MSICILLATYNGERFLTRQLESLQAQSVSGWQCLIRDDGSTDATIEILDSFASKDPRFQIISDGVPAQASACQNFARLCEAGLQTSSEFFFFCDQDDIWHKNKLKAQLTELQAVSPKKPVLVHHDLELIDAQGKAIHPSFIKLMRLKPESASCNKLLGRNVVTGCASAFNRQLLELSLPIPHSAIMHDWWLALIASLTGKILFLDQPLISYRQHEHNTIGAKSFWAGLNPMTNWVKGWQRGNADFRATICQARALLQHVQSCPKQLQLAKEQHKYLRIYCNLSAVRRVERIKLAFHYQLLPDHWLLKMIKVSWLLSL